MHKIARTIGNGAVRPADLVRASLSSPSVCWWLPSAWPSSPSPCSAVWRSPSPSSGLVIIAGSLAGSEGDRGLPSWSRPQLPGRAHRGTGALRGPARLLRMAPIGAPGPHWWRAVAYSVLKMPLAAFGVWFAFSVWVDAFFCLTYPVWGRGSTSPAEFGVMVNVFPPGYLSVGTNGFFHRTAHLHHRRGPGLRRPLDHAGRGLHRPSTHARPAGP